MRFRILVLAAVLIPLGSAYGPAPDAVGSRPLADHEMDSVRQQDVLLYPAKCTPEALRILLQKRNPEVASQNLRSVFGIKADDVMYHDCQKLVLDDAYQTLAAIFVSDGLEGLEATEVIGQPRHVATIYADDTFGFLKVNKGYTCVYWYNPDETGDIAVFVADTSPICPAVTTNTSNSLRIHRRKSGLHGKAAYIPVTRWDEGTTSAGRTSSYFGFGCDGRWCEVVPEGLTESDAAGRWPGAKEKSIKGWHDRQVLLEKYGRDWKRGTVTGTIVPESGLATRDTNYFKKFRKVAEVHLDVESVTYMSKYGFTKGDNEVRLLYQSGKWIAMIVNGQKDQFIRDVVWNKHTGALDGARFSWSEEDEQLWVRCANGCCLVGGDDFER